MSLSRPVVKFPLLKLPWLCIKCVLLNSDLFDIIYFATISNRTRRIVQHSKYPVKEIGVIKNPNRCGMISIKHESGTEYQKYWYFMHHVRGNGVPLVLQKGSQPFLTSRHFDSSKGLHYLESCTDGDELSVLKMGIDFMIDLFGCSIGLLLVDDQLWELFILGISSVKELYICKSEPVNITDLKCLLEYIEVTEEYVFSAPIPANFSCDLLIFNCRRVVFLCEHSANWVTLEVLCQFDASQLLFFYHRFSKQDIVLYVTHWFHSGNKKLEYLLIYTQSTQISSEDFQTKELNPVPFTGRTHIPPIETYTNIDFSVGLEIVRNDGSVATIYFNSGVFLFYVWHSQ